jgi:hypothetical protein
MSGGLPRSRSTPVCLTPLSETRDSHNIGNIATALAVILPIYEAHRSDLKDGAIDPATGEPRHKGWLPLNVLFGRGTIPAPAAAVIDRAVQAMIGRDEIAHDEPWQALEFWAADYLAGAGPDPAHLADSNNTGGRA